MHYFTEKKPFFKNKSQKRKNLETVYSLWTKYIFKYAQENNWESISQNKNIGCVQVVGFLRWWLNLFNHERKCMIKKIIKKETRLILDFCCCCCLFLHRET